MKNLKNLILLFLSISITVMSAEFLLRILYPSLLISQDYLFSPHSVSVFKPTSGTMPGIFGNSRFITNSYGIRGDELSSEYTKRILVIGGSAAECLYLDQEESWPYLIQKKLNKISGRNDVWVGNVGLSGKNTNDHLKLLRGFPLKKLKIDTVILLVGFNDFCRRLALGENYTPSYLQKESNSTFFKKTAIWNLLRKTKYALSKKPRNKIQDHAGEMYVKLRENRSSAKKIIDIFPDLSSALEEYAQNINAIIDIAEKDKVDIIFLTQPSLWKSNLSPELQSLLWFGGIGNYQEEKGHEYYSIKALSLGIEEHNNTLLKICKLRNVKYIDLAALLSKNASIFYDDCHFNENGSRIVSEILTNYLLTKTRDCDRFLR